jgi:hypothetical protein
MNNLTALLTRELSRNWAALKHFTWSCAQASGTNNDQCRTAANAIISHRLNRAYAMQSDTLLEPLIMGQGELFQHYPNMNMRQSTRTVNCKVATLRATSKSLITCNEHLSSAEHCIEQLVGWFDQAQSRGASTAVYCQTVERTQRCAMRCPEWSAKHASFDPATLLLRPFPHGFLRAKVHSQ